MKKYFEIEIEGQKVLIEGTLEIQNLIREMNELDASIDNLTSFLNQTKFSAEKSLDDIQKLKGDLGRKIDEKFSKLIIIKLKLKDKVYTRR